MSYSRVQSVNNASFASATSFTVTLAAVASGNAVVGFVYDGAGSGQTVTSIVDDKGNHYNQSTTVIGQVDFSEQGTLFWLGDITNGPTVITVTLSAAAGNWIIIAEEWSGVKAATDPSDGHTQQSQNTPGTTTDAITSGAITTTVNGDLVWGVSADVSSHSVAVSAGTGYTISTTYNASIATITSETKTQSAAGSVAATWTQAANDSVINFVVALQPAGGGATRAPTLTLMGVG